MRNLELFNEHLEDLGLDPMDENEAKDWLSGEETEEDLMTMARELASELSSEMASLRGVYDYD